MGVDQNSDRASFLLSMRRSAIEGRVRHGLPFSRFRESTVDVVEGSAEVSSCNWIFKFPDCEITEYALPSPKKFLPRWRLPSHPSPYPPDKSLDQDFRCHVF